jgi:Family of unknown function (DUF6262)
MAADQAGRLAEHARARHEQTLQRAQDALAALARNGEPVTVARLAGEAGVSRAWIYTQPGLRDQIERTQRGHPSGTPPARQARSRAAAWNWPTRKSPSCALRTSSSAATWRPPTGSSAPRQPAGRETAGDRARDRHPAPRR